MKINSLEYCQSHLGTLCFPPDKRVILICGKDSDAALDHIRVLIGDAVRIGESDLCETLYASVEIGGKSFDVCGILNGDGIGNHRVGVGYMPGVSSDAVIKNAEYAEHLSRISNGGDNVFLASEACREPCGLLSESDRILCALDRFVDSARRAADLGDERPVFVYGAFDRIDEAESRKRLVKALLTVGRQVFVAVMSPNSVGELAYDAPDHCCILSI